MVLSVVRVGVHDFSNRLAVSLYVTGITTHDPHTALQIGGICKLCVL